MVMGSTGKLKLESICCQSITSLGSERGIIPTADFSGSWHRRSPPRHRGSLATLTKPLAKDKVYQTKHKLPSKIHFARRIPGRLKGQIPWKCLSSWTTQPRRFLSSRTARVHVPGLPQPPCAWPEPAMPSSKTRLRSQKSPAVSLDHIWI